MIISIIQKSQLEGAMRLDAEYYQPEYLEISRKIKTVSFKTLGEISDRVVSFGAYSLTNFIEWKKTGGVPFIVAGNIGEGFINYEGVRYITKTSDEVLKKSRVQEGQVLLAMSGSVGNTAVAVNIPPRLNSNQDIVKITPKEGISPYFLAAFLNSKYGKKQVLRLPVGSVQQHIFLWQIKSLLIPSFSQNKTEEIEKIYKRSLLELSDSKKYYSQAEDLLLEELGLAEEEFKNELSYVVDFSDVRSASRIDAEHFQPKYKKLISKIKTKNPKLLLNVAENVPAEFRPQTQPERAFKYVALANINSLIGTVDGSKEVLGKEAPSRAKRILKTGDIIVSSIEGSLKKTALISKEQEGYLASTGFFQFRSEKILPEVLLVLAKSVVLQLQFKKYVIGTILAAVPQNSLAKIVIPILPKPTQQKIANLVRQSHEARRKSKQLLEKAKKEVEEMIEKGRK